MRRLRSSSVGVALTAGFSGWVVLSAAVAGGSAWPILGAVAVAASAYTIGRLLGGHRIVVAGVLAACIGVTMLATVRMVNLDLPLKVGKIDAGPFGYANADGALAVQGAAAAAIVMVTSRHRGLTWLAACWGIGLSLAPLAAASWGGAFAAGVVVVSGILALLPWRAPVAWFAAGCVTLVCLVPIATIGLAANHDGGGDAPDAVTDALTERRLDLWADALDQVREHPLTGVGPGQFDIESATARSDPDTQAAHSLWLESAAELGVPGAALLVALALWPLAGLVTSRAAVSFVGVGAWTALALHAGIDYVTDFWPVVAATALVVGLVTASARERRSEQLDVPEVKRVGRLARG